MRITRLFAQIIDWFASLAALVFSFVFLLPLLKKLTPNLAVVAVLVLLAALFLAVLVQLPFLFANQTLGKGFFGLEIQSTNPDRPLTPSVIIQREIFCKLFSCYLLCLPVLIGKAGAHEGATETRVVRKARRSAVKKHG